MPFQKGRSGNPNGRPKKGTSFAELLERELDLHHGKSDLTKRKRVVAVVVEQACAGSLDALKWIVERTEGKVADKVDATVNQRTEHVVSPDTVAAVLAGYALRGRPGTGTP
jgi:hypothetical protein